MTKAPALFAACAFALSACDGSIQNNSYQSGASGPQPGTAGFSVVAAGAPVGAVVDQFAITVLNGIQAQSIAEHREYCGYIWQDQAGRLQATRPVAGTRLGCEMPAPQVGTGILASYHTHGAYDAALAGEVPSAVDLHGDFAYGMNGYVSTPAGRVWLVDNQTRSTRQICGRGCVRSDPRYVAAYDANIQHAYRVDQLR